MKKIYTLIFIFVVLLISTKSTYSQCTNCGSQYPSAIQSTTSSTMTTISTLMYGSDYAVCNVTSGNTYTWATCGDTDFDTQLSLIQGTGCGGTSLAYNDDGCGTQSTITWTATFTGVVTILVSQYNCLSNSIAMTLQWSVTGGTSVATAGDCSSAIDVCTNLGFQIDANGFGTVNEIPTLGGIGNPDNNNPGGSGHSGCLRIGESNSTWMIISIGSTGNLEFNFGGASQAGYYDWIMYPYNASSCSAIPNNLVAPVRCNWNGSSTGGTGLSAAYTTNSNFEPPLPVQCGDQYIICFSNYSSASTNVPLQFSGTATVACSDLTCAGNAACSSASGSTAFQNCIGAIPVCQNYFCQEASFSGVGTVTGEIPVGNTCLGSGEKNDAWYVLTVQQAGNLNFTITPNSGTDDYDWAVFNLTNATCAQIPTDATLDVSCNYSSNIGCAGLTGPNGENVNCAAQNENVIPVLAGETYVINVSNFSSTQAGYALDFSASTAVIFDNIPPTLDLITSTPACGSTSITIRFSEQVLCSSVQACDFTVTGPGGPYTVTSMSGTACAAGGTQGSVFTVNFTPAVTTAGSYNINLVSTCGYVEDLCGNLAPIGSLPFTISGVSSTVTQTNHSCFGDALGVASVTVTGGGSPPYTYNWSNGTNVGPTALTTSSISGLTGLNYSVTITNSAGCSQIRTFTLTQPPLMTIALTPAPASCGSSNGTILVTVTNGTANYNYSCPPAVASNGNPSNTYTFTGLAAGTFPVTVTSGAGCTATGSATIGNTGSVTSSFTYDGNHCAGATPFIFTNTGTTGGGATYAWSFAGGTPATSTLVNGPVAGVTFATSGTHVVTLVTTQGTCNATFTMNIAAYPVPVPNVDTTSINCNGSCNGIATAYPTGGTAFIYAWSNLATTQAITGLCVGNYTVTVSNTDGCSSTQTVTITQPAAFSLTTTRQEPTCFGLCDGTANVSVIPVGAYTYNWSGGSTPTAATTSSLCMGTYNVTVTAAPGCTQTGTVTVGEPLDIILTTSTTPATCGNPTGTATVNVTNGFPLITYNWITVAQNTQTATGLGSGSYPVIVTDSHGCIKTATANVSSSNGPSASIVSSIDVICNGQSNGSAIATASGGIGTLTYLWDSGTAPLNQLSVAGLNAGIHTITVTDSNGCTATASVTINEPTALSANTSPIGANCGQPIGSIQANPNGGTSPYTFVWNSVPAQTTQIATALVPGLYTVIVTDDHGCTTNSSGTINNLPGVSVVVKSWINPTCNGLCDGSAAIESVGGIPNYTYSVSAPSGYTTTSASINIIVPNLCDGTYTITVTDGNGCQDTALFTIVQPVPVTASITSSTNINCNGGNNGEATAAGNGGTAPYTGIWNTIPAQASLTASGLIVGTYSVTVSDFHNCTATTTVVISQPSAISLTTNKTNAHCGLADGTANVAAIGGTVTTGYTYQWSGGTAPLNLSNVTGLLASGSPYTVTVTDNNGCTATANVTITNIPPGTAAISTFTNVNCFGQTNGSATVSIGGGQAPFTYLWNTIPPQITSTATGLGIGTYTANVTDANNCVVSANVTITEPAQISNTFTVSNATCFGQCNGQIGSSISGGTTPYSYQWSNLQAISTISNLCAGNYTLTIIDAHGCIQTFNRTITEPGQIFINGTVTNANCNQSDGAISVLVTGGVTPFQFQWNSGETTLSVTNKPSGTYTIAVVDTNGCNATSTFQINNISGPSASITAQQNVICYGASDGFATVSVNGGSGQYNYQWSTIPAQLTSTASNLGPNIYNVTVTDIISGCTIGASVTITEPQNITMNTQMQEPLCNGQCNGTATVTPFGGISPYTYQWIGGGSSTTDSINTGLCAGSYTILITDNNNCFKSQTVNVTEPEFVSISYITSTSLLCSGLCNGTASVTATGGTNSFTYQWSVNANSQTTQQAISLCSDTYDVTVSDNNNCTATGSTFVSTPAPIVISLTSLQHVQCYAQSDGNIIIGVTGGVSSPNFIWSNGLTTYTTQDLINIPYGNYCVTVSDNNGCSKDTCFIVSQPPLLQVSTTAHDETCSGLCNGYIVPNVLGGQQPYTYLWSNISINDTASNLCPNIYTVTVTDFNNCTAVSFDSVHGHSILDVMTIDTTMATCGQSNGSAVISVTGGSWTFTYHWPAGVGSISSSANNLAAGAYTVTVIDANNCRDSLQINISNAAGPIIDSITVQNISCFGAQNGSLHAYYHGSTISYSVAWNSFPSQTGDIASNLTPGSYSVIITDGNGCVTSGNRIITQPTVLQSAVTNNTNATCYGSCNGSATVMVNGGTQPWSYAWSGGGATSSVSNLCVGSYTVTVTDAHYCSSISSISISQPDSIHIQSAVQNASCYGSDNGQIVLTVTGGTGYFYNWFPNVSGNSVASPLIPGNYTVMVTDYYDPTCIKSASFIITEPDSIYTTLGFTMATCGLQNGEAFITSPIQGGTFPYSLHWSPGNIQNDTVYNATQGTYQFSITDANNCVYNSSVSVGSILPPVLFSSITTNVSCPGNTDGSVVITVKEGTPPFSYSWSPFLGNDSIVSSYPYPAIIYSLPAGTYTVTITDLNGCQLQTAFIISQPSPLNIHADGTRWICNGQYATISANASGGTIPYSYQWLGLPSTNQVQVVNPSATISYPVLVVDSRGCSSDTAFVTIFVYPDVFVNVFADTGKICKGTSTNLHALASGGNGGPYNFYWQDLADTVPLADREVYPLDTTTYYVYAVDNCGSPSHKDSVTIVVLPVPVVNIIANKLAGCEPLEVFFHNIDTASNVYLLWNFNDLYSGNNTTLDNHPSHTFLQDGSYNVTLQITTEDGCTETDNQAITVYPNPDAKFNAWSVYDGAPFTASLFHPSIQFIDISTETITSREWNFGDNRTSGLVEPIHSYESAGTYHVWLYVRTDKGCIDSVVKDVMILDEFTLYVPTAFDPNSPVNKEFYPQGKGIDKKNYHLWIFDRWGEIMFETTDFEEHWDGKFLGKGDYVKSGSYVWYIWVKDTYGKAHEKTGPVTVIR